MRQALSLFLTMAVLLCGLHIGEPDTPHPVAAHQLAQDDGAADPAAAGHEAPGQAEDAGHHHCPVALDAASPAPPCAAFSDASPVARPIAALASLAQAPPTEPPLA